MTVQVDIAIECDSWATALPDLDGVARRAVDAGLEVSPVPDFQETELSLLFCDDQEIQRLNFLWRKQDKPTNVLSFPAGSTAPGPIRMLGDIALAFETTEREARAEGKTLSAHVSHLIVHGLLHLLGSDHEDEAEAERMEEQERAALARLGIPDPYQTPSGDPR